MVPGALRWSVEFGKFSEAITCGRGTSEDTTSFLFSIGSDQNSQLI